MDSLLDYGLSDEDESDMEEVTNLSSDKKRPADGKLEEQPAKLPKPDLDFMDEEDQNKSFTLPSFTPSDVVRPLPAPFLPPVTPPISKALRNGLTIVSVNKSSPKKNATPLSLIPPQVKTSGKKKVRPNQPTEDQGLWISDERNVDRRRRESGGS